MIKRLTIPALEYIVTSLNQVENIENGVIPDISSRYPGKLEQCLAAPFLMFGGKDLYPSLEDKASILFYSIIKNHPLENGNKRLACIALLTLLILNQKWIKVNDYDLKALTIVVASSTPGLKDEIMNMIKMILRSKMQNL